MSNPTIFLERYQSTSPIEPQEFFVYDIHRKYTDPATNLISVARAIAGFINMNKTPYYAVTDDNVIYTKVSLAPFYLSGYTGNRAKQTYCEYELLPKDKQKISPLNKIVYQNYIELLIESKLRNYHAESGFFSNDKYKKYIIRNHEIHSIYTRISGDKKSQYKRLNNKNFASDSIEPPDVWLAREYDTQVEVKDDAHFLLSLSTKAEFIPCRSLYDRVREDKEKIEDLIGEYVRYSLPTGLSQTGSVVPVDEYIAANPGRNPKVDATVEGTISYLGNKYSKSHYIQDFIQNERNKRPDDFILYMRLRNSASVYHYLASTLYPIPTTEFIAERYPDFSKAVTKYMRIDMQKRIDIDREFLDDIGYFPELGKNIRISPSPCTAEEAGFKTINLEKTRLRVGNGKIIYPDFSGKRSFFQPDGGFYSLPDSVLKKGALSINILGDSDEFTEEHLLCFLRYLYKYGGLSNASHAYSKKYPQGIRFQPHVYLASYNAGVTEVTRAANNMNRSNPADINIIVLDNYNRRFPTGYHDRLKKELARKCIPSQMVTKEKFWGILREYDQKEYRLKKKPSTFNIPDAIRYKLSLSSKAIEAISYNLNIQILSKIGGIPGVLSKPLPGNIDLILGLDVGMGAKGIHYPAGSVMIDNQGYYLGSYATSHAQSGEKIPPELLEDILNTSLGLFEDQKGQLPHRVLIMRDGFSHEDESFYAKYFHERNIVYDIIEVRKNTGTRLAKGYISSTKSYINNPEPGICIAKEDEVILVSSEGHTGSPRPLTISRSFGKLSMEEIAQICFALTKIYPGSMQNVRLPYPTYVADKICKSYDYIPHGIITNKNFFM